VWKAQLLDENFPYFVRERFIRDLIVLSFQSKGQPLRMYIEQVFRAADFLEYKGSEQQLVYRIVMNFHPSILAHAAFLVKPRSLKEMYHIVGLIEEKFRVLKERQRMEWPSQLSSSGSVGSRNASRSAPVHSGAPASVTSRCWGCGRYSHFRRDCPHKSPSSGNGQSPGGRQSPGPRYVSGLRKETEVLRDTSLWLILELKTGKVPALVDTGAQLSCIRSDVAEFLYLREKTCAFSSCSLSCLLADGKQCEVTDAQKLQV